MKAVLAALGIALACATASADEGSTALGTMDVQHYGLDLHVDPAAKSLRGSVVIRAQLLSSAPTTLALDLDRALTVDTAALNGKPADFQRRDDQILIAINEGQALSIAVTYHGTPQGKGFTFAQRNGQPAISNYGMPFTARQWWPCKDDPADKADTADIAITVPMPLTAASNGKLLATDTNADGTRTFRWHVGYPIYPDTLSVAIAEYTVVQDRYRAANGQVMPLSFYVFPPDENKARRDFGVIPDIMRAHAQRFGEYPFLREKYGVAEFATYSFREHQTLPSYAEKLITGDHANDAILAHELAHQWFGNSLSVRDWRHVWLNEGFSTYAAMLWIERRKGAAAYRAEMDKSAEQDLHGPIFVADVTDNKKLFGAATFDKGAWVLHMLRHVMGDAKFFDALRAYVKQYSYSNVTTEDFRAVCERVYGKSLEWFFAQWVYGVSRPTYRVSWAAADDHLALTIRQTQTDALAFTMPIDVAVTTASGVIRRTVWNDRNEQTFEIPHIYMSGKPSSIKNVSIDPDGWILKRVIDQSADTVFELRQYTLHPGQRDVLVDVFDDNFVEGQEAVGMRVIGQYRDLDDPDRFVWLRSFSDMESRKAALTAFYSGPIWKAHGRLAAGTMVDSDNVLLLRPLRPDTAFAPSTIKLPPAGTRGPGKGVLVASVVYIERNTPREFGEFFQQQLQSRWERGGGTVIAQLVSEHSANTYPALPVRDKEDVFVWFSLFPDQATVDELQRALAQSMEWREAAGQLTTWTHRRIETLRLEPTARSRLQAP